MNLTEMKPLDEIADVLDGESKTLLLVCGGCPIGCETAAPDKVEGLSTGLAEKGKAVVGVITIDFLCNKALVGQRLNRNLDKVKEADAIVVLSCGVGVQATAAMVDKPVRAAMNTISIHGVQGLWPSHERCAQCGDCKLNYTGGICPVTTCAKSLLNGACGGSHGGKCEVDPDRDCGWYLIYERLQALGQLDRLRHLFMPASAQKADIPEELRTTVRWALEVDEELEAKKRAEKAAKKGKKKKKKKKA